jgi:uncharacterized membrane protein YeaQ/YmgE (transglycosylase-associated protein family)
MKGVVIWVMTGALAGIVAASFIVPPMLSWYNEAGFLAQGNQAAAMVNLPEVVRYSTSRLIRGQAIGAVIGAVVFFALGLALGSRRRSRTAVPSSPSDGRE